MQAELQKKWPGTALHQHAIQSHPQLTIDWITTAGTQPVENMLVFSTGEHGIEGYVGSAVLEFFYREYIPRLDPNTTALTLIHMIDPWGMKNFRRTNPENVDLNRNFVRDTDLIDPGFNPNYAKINEILNPQNKANNLLLEKTRFLIRYLYYLAVLGKKAFWEAKIFGQYAFPQGIHYGGSEVQEEVEILESIFRQAFAGCKKLVHLDMHTGYGPRYQMTVVNSPLEPKGSAYFKNALNYPLVAAMNPDEFYEVRGDLVDFVYLLRNHEYPEVELYATAFEFGTFGISHWQRVRAMRAMIFENQLYWHGAGSSRIEKAIRQEFLESFSPSEQRWRIKAITDADQALKGILEHQGLIPGT